jgi:tetratricopeptide (TPR) repeat protein
MKRPSATAIAAAASIALLVNTAYVWAFASPTIFYMTNVLGHVALGIVVAVASSVVLARRPDLRRTLSAPAALFALALVLGVYLTVHGNLLSDRPVLLAHIAAGTAAIAALAPSAWRSRRQGRSGTAWSYAYAFAAVWLLVLPAGTSAYARFHWTQSARIENPATAPGSMLEEGGGPQSPFFPSSARTNVGGIIPSNFFMDSATCGECHKDIYEQWRGSVHHFASFNNQFYRKSVEYMQSVTGTQASKWCAGCHDHAVFFNGRFDRPIAEQIDTPEARAGLACTSCHAIVRVGSTMGNGDFTIEYPPLHELATSRNRYVRAVDRFLTYLNPEPHRRTFMKPFMRQAPAEFCSVCHKVHLDVPVNGYRWLRGFNDYDAWQASGVSGQGARSFYYPPTTSTCVDCHMPPARSDDPGHHSDGTVHSHRFPAANMAVPFVNHDARQLQATESFLTSGALGVDIFAVSPLSDQETGTVMLRRSAEAPQAMSSFAVGEEAERQQPVFVREVGRVAAPVDKAAPPIARGSAVRVDVVVRTRKVGHFFPAGTVDAFDVWLELQGRDADGRVIFWSGRIEDDGKGPVEPGAHFYRSYQLDAHGNAIDKRNAWQTRSVLYVRLIPPGAADVAHFRVRVPPDARGPITLTASLNYRKFAHYYTQFAYAGEPAPGQPASRIGRDFNDLTYSFNPANIPKNVSGDITDRIPDLPVVTLARATTHLDVSDHQTPNDRWRLVLDGTDRERWNDWGIGLLLQGDLRAAEYAFEQVTRIDPKYADGWLNAARALISEGEMEAARPFVDHALAVNPSLDRMYFFKAMIEKAGGDYGAALASLERTARQYPRDRVVLNQMARVLFLQREYAKALEVLDRVCAIDPEDLQMHYTAMLAARGLGDNERARREELLFRRFKADEPSQAITAVRRRLSPEENNERQAIHDHDSVRLGPEARAPR